MGSRSTTEKRALIFILSATQGALLDVLSAHFGPRSSKWLQLALVHSHFNKFTKKIVSSHVISRDGV